MPSASAEDGVAVTGLVDLGLMVQHANGRTNTTMESGNNKTSTIDIRATETISDDLWVRAASYVSFMPDTGTLYEDGVLFDGAALTLGSKTFGEVALGRMGALKSTDGDMSQFALAEGYSPMGANLPHAGLAYIFTCDGILNNTVGYASPSFSGYRFFAQYSNGVTTETGVGADDDRLLTVSVLYNNHEKLRFGGIATYHTHGTLAEDHNATKDIMVSMNYDFDAFRLYLTYQHVFDGLGPNTMLRAGAFGFGASEKGFDTDAFMAGFMKDIAGGTLSAVFQASRSEYKGDANDGNLSTSGWRINPAAIYRYPVSRRTTLWTALSWTHGYGMYRRVKDHPVDNPNTTSWGAGVTHFF
ncbi:porin [Sutterella faecalis]|uniref:porin n=1 Tax=Sutterella faecalis TaxID=2584944 RepID=UPI001D03D7C6|nr:porin [Sutterella faecalis]